jgi:mannose-1-phosphate guanylyltransferase
MLWAVIMAGGAGTRFWPESREKNPKQFLPNIFGRKTLFEETLQRIAPVIPKSRVIVVTQKRYESQVRKLARIPAAHILGEPVGRNTAPCVAVAAALILKEDPKAVIAILPSDHQIGKAKQFQKILNAAYGAALQHDMPVTFGLKPDFPHTGYGYLEMDRLFERRGGLPVYRLKRFHEKPDAKKAKAFLKTGKFLWNGGIFVWRADRLLAATEKYLPKVASGVRRMMAGSFKARFQREYASMPSISIDYGLMEPLKGKILTIPADIDWCDLGGWMAFQDLWPEDKQGNRIQGKQVLLADSSGNLVRSGKRLTALVGVSNLVIVDTGDALLVASKEKVESVRKIVTMLRERRWRQYL